MQRTPSHLELTCVRTIQTSPYICWSQSSHQLRGTSSSRDGPRSSGRTSRQMYYIPSKHRCTAHIVHSCAQHVLTSHTKHISPCVRTSQSSHQPNGTSSSRDGPRSSGRSSRCGCSTSTSWWPGTQPLWARSCWQGRADFSARRYGNIPPPPLPPPPQTSRS